MVLNAPRELQPPADPYAQKVPDQPLPWQPVVQRGLISVEGNARYPQGVALGFTGGTLLFDAKQLAPVAIWHGGFVKSTPQNYFGLDWTREGGPAEMIAATPHPLRFKLPGQDGWQSFEPASVSDPNTGTRFDGYQIGRAAVRLHYRVLVGKTSRLESRKIFALRVGLNGKAWHASFVLRDCLAGCSRRFGVIGRGHSSFHGAAGQVVDSADNVKQASSARTAGEGNDSRYSRSDR